MTTKVFALDTKPGIQRDGTVFDKDVYNDGRWVRFQRGRPRKMWGYREIIDNLAGPSRGIYMDPRANFTNIYSGFNNGLQLLPIDNNGIGTGLIDLTLSNFTPSNDNVWQFDALRDVGGAGADLLAHPGRNLSDINNQINTPVLAGDIAGTTFAQLYDTASGDPVEVSGGVVVLHPYVFVYGNQGLIKNCSAGNPYDWSSPDANEVNAASTKIVQGLPVLFWSLDSLVRVSYQPATVGASQIFWRYDIISSQSSILSSQSVIEYDGIYYWCGVDRFLMYNGVVKEIPNPYNQNWFFDNLNYAQRQKVWVSKVPRFGEIWWFYPRGESLECNDAVIYNIRENCWYDAGTALGAYRSAGYFSQVFHYPVNADWTPNSTTAIDLIDITNPGSGYTDGVYNNEPLTGGTGTGATANITVAGGVVTSIVMENRGIGYTVGDLLSAVLPAGIDFIATVTALRTYVSLYQHEIGVNAIKGGNTLAVESYFETNDLGAVSGGPSQPSMVGDNVWLRLERVEPDFIMSGEMELYVTGRPYAQTADYTSQAYLFDENTGKIDMKEQRRELRLKIVSNTLGGNYQLGRMLLNADIGDVRGY
jgi:hypothetical protein